MINNLIKGVNHMKTNNITHKIYHQKNNVKMSIDIRLNDECKNGHADFAITADAKEYYNGRWQDSFCGCCHEEILARYPKLKKFVDLHLSDSNGAPMYAQANGFYHLWDENKTKEERKRITKEYMRCTEAEFKQLAKTKDKEYFHYMIDVLKLPIKWKKEADQAIKELEKLSGQKWDNSYKWVRSNYTSLTTKQKQAVKNKIDSGFYSDRAMKKREEERHKQEIKKQLADIEKDRRQAVEKINVEANLDKWLIEKIEWLKKKDRTHTFLMSFKNSIYYNHSNELCFNWVSYEPRTTQKSFKFFCDNITEKEFQNILPKGINFVLKENDKKVLSFCAK
jgi:hypothetical protein